MLDTQQHLLTKILAAIDLYRGLVLDSCEQECADSHNWRYLRSRLLKAFGDRGLEGKIKEIVAIHFDREGR